MKLPLPVASGSMGDAIGSGKPVASRSVALGCPRPAPAARGGFTLVELMIVVAIVAILTAIAYPSYTHYIIKTRRSAAKACLSEVANYMERYYTTNLSYAAAADPLLDCESASQTGNYYGYAVTITTPTKYNLSAAPKANQPDTECGTLKLDQTGARTVTGTSTTCW